MPPSRFRRDESESEVKHVEIVYPELEIKENQSNFTEFNETNTKKDELRKKNIRYNNKILHQSKLIKYFEEDYSKDWKVMKTFSPNISSQEKEIKYSGWVDAVNKTIKSN